MEKIIGILLIVLGAIVLLVSYFTEMVDNNAIQFAGLGLIIAGVITHILIQKYAK